MPDIPEANGEIQTIELVNEKTGEEESYVVHDVVEIEGETYYVLQAEADEEQVLILRREGESLVTLDDEEHDRVVEQLEAFEPMASAVRERCAVTFSYRTPEDDADLKNTTLEVVLPESVELSDVEPGLPALPPTELAGRVDHERVRESPGCDVHRF